MTDGAPVNLSGALPSEPGEVMAWMREAQAGRATI